MKIKFINDIDYSLNGYQVIKRGKGEIIEAIGLEEAFLKNSTYIKTFFEEIKEEIKPQIEVIQEQNNNLEDNHHQSIQKQKKSGRNRNKQ